MASKKGSIVLSEIQIFINKGDGEIVIINKGDDRREDNKPQVPMLVQTMSILELIKEKKVLRF